MALLKRQLRCYICFLGLIVCCQLRSQHINFNAYENISNIDLIEFSNLFESRELPISTDQIVSGVDLNNLSKSEITVDHVRSFLQDTNGGFVIDPLYYHNLEDDQEDYPEYGTFYPLFKLPTNGDYVILVMARLDDEFRSVRKVFCMSYDLDGNVINYVAELFDSSSQLINALIDNQMKFHYSYVLYEENGEWVFPPVDVEFDGIEATVIYSITQQGTKTEESFIKTPAHFSYSNAEERFQKTP